MTTIDIDTAPMNLWNGVLRFGIELAALGGLAVGGSALAEGPARWVLAIGLPIAASVVWGTFRIPGDPGPAPVAVPGKTRLTLELVVFGGGVAGYAVVSGALTALGLGSVVVLHHLFSLDRLRWMLEH